jgi:hypothetical protein
MRELGQACGRSLKRPVHSSGGNRDDLHSHCSLVAILALVLGTFRVLLGVAIATEFIGPYEVALAHYTSKSSSGQVIDGGMYAIIFALALGTLAEISFSVRKPST